MGSIRTSKKWIFLQFLPDDGKINGTKRNKSSICNFTVSIMNKGGFSQTQKVSKDIGQYYILSSYGFH